MGLVSSKGVAGGWRHDVLELGGHPRNLHGQAGLWAAESVPISAAHGHVHWGATAHAHIGRSPGRGKGLAGLVGEPVVGLGQGCAVSVESEARASTGGVVSRGQATQLAGVGPQMEGRRGARGARQKMRVGGRDTTPRALEQCGRTRISYKRSWNVKSNDSTAMFAFRFCEPELDTACHKEAYTERWKGDGSVSQEIRT